MERKIIVSCPTLKKELEKAVEEAGFAGEVCFIPQSLHSSPKELRKYLQDMIDRAGSSETGVWEWCLKKRNLRNWNMQWRCSQKETKMTQNRNLKQRSLPYTAGKPAGSW